MDNDYYWKLTNAQEVVIVKIYSSWVLPANDQCGIARRPMSGPGGDEWARWTVNHYHHGRTVNKLFQHKEETL